MPMRSERYATHVQCFQDLRILVLPVHLRLPKAVYETRIGSPLPPLDGDYVLSRYPVLKIHHTVPRQIARKRTVIARLTPTLTSAIP